jgi:hypothetical protein
MLIPPDQGERHDVAEPEALARECTPAQSVGRQSTFVRNEDPGKG